MAIRLSQIAQYAVLALVAISIVLTLIALCLPWYGLHLKLEIATVKVEAGVSLHPFYQWMTCSSSEKDLCDNACTGMHSWGTTTSAGKCVSGDTETANQRALYVSAWIFDLIGFVCLLAVAALYAPGARDKIMEKLPPKARGFGPIAVGVFATFWLLLSFLCFWIFFSTAVCNDGDAKDCDISFIENDKEEGASISSAPTWGWATTVSAAGLMVFAVCGMVAHTLLARKEQGGEYATIGEPGPTYT